LHAKVVDLDAAAARAPAETLAQRLLDELLVAADSFEIGYPAGRRTVYAPRAAPLVPSPALLGEPTPSVRAGDVLLVTGGARGITAGLARKLARPGVTMIVVGRSPAAENDDTQGADAKLTNDPALDEAALRRQLLDAARAAGERPVPATIEQRLRAILNRRQQRASLRQLAERGVQVEYHAVDVRDEHAMRRLIDGIYQRHGRLDGVLHGAGIIEDRLIAAKQAQSFARVFATKADSAFLLARLLRPEGLRWMVLFSSIAGRIGNRGQADYAAANEVVNRFAWYLAQRWSQTRVVAINWGPWRGGGMASPGVLQQLEARGITPLEPESGLRFLLSELRAGQQAEVIAGDGPWNADPGETLDALFRLDLLGSPRRVATADLPS